VTNPHPSVTKRQTGAVAAATRLHGSSQYFRTAPFLDATLPTLSAHSLADQSVAVFRGAYYFRGSGNCSTMNAHPLLSLGFFSAFLITWIFMFLLLN
jgi:hypothetical protein